MSYQDALEAALCFGWIDGQKRPFDAAHWLQRFTPRSKRSRWSKRNTELAEQLSVQGAMRPAGLREVELAKADGRWEAAYAGQRTATVPPGPRTGAVAPAAGSGHSSSRSTRPIGTPSCTASRRPNGPRHGRAGWTRSWACWRPGRSSTRSRRTGYAAWRSARSSTADRSGERCMAEPGGSGLVGRPVLLLRHLLVFGRGMLWAFGFEPLRMRIPSRAKPLPALRRRTRCGDA